MIFALFRAGDQSIDFAVWPFVSNRCYCLIVLILRLKIHGCAVHIYAWVTKEKANLNCKVMMSLWTSCPYFIAISNRQKQREREREKGNGFSDFVRVWYLQREKECKERLTRQIKWYKKFNFFLILVKVIFDFWTTLNRAGRVDRIQRIE